MIFDAARFGIRAASRVPEVMSSRPPALPPKSACLQAARVVDVSQAYVTLNQVIAPVLPATLLTGEAGYVIWVHPAMSDGSPVMIRSVPRVMTGTPTTLLTGYKHGGLIGQPTRSRGLPARATALSSWLDTGDRSCHPRPFASRWTPACWRREVLSPFLAKGRLSKNNVRPMSPLMELRPPSPVSPFSQPLDGKELRGLVANESFGQKDLVGAVAVFTLVTLRDASRADSSPTNPLSTSNLVAKSTVLSILLREVQLNQSAHKLLLTVLHVECHRHTTRHHRRPRHLAPGQ